MTRTIAFALAFAPLGVAALAPAPALAQAADPIGQVIDHLRALDSMTADFAQTDRKGRVLTGTLILKKPGRLRFQYGQGVPLLIVSDGKSLRMIDYQVKQVSRWPVSKSPLALLTAPGENLRGTMTVLQNDDRLLVVRAHDRKQAQFGTTTLAFAKVAGAPAGLMLQGWTARDVQNNNTIVRLSNQRINVAVADSAFDWVDPRAGKRR